MDTEKHLCLSIYNHYQYFNCDLDNRGSYLSPIYSCQKCDSDYRALVSLENGIKICIQEESLQNCNEVEANTSYANT